MMARISFSTSEGASRLILGECDPAEPSVDEKAELRNTNEPGTILVSKEIRKWSHERTRG